MITDKESLQTALIETMGRDAVEAKCNRCGVQEWVISLDAPIDDLFVANYHCEDCDGLGTAEKEPEAPIEFA